MRRFQQLCAVTSLLFVLSLPALAGTIHTNAVDPPPPPPPTSAMATEPDDATTDGIQSATDYETLITEIAMSVLQLLAVV